MRHQKKPPRRPFEDAQFFTGAALEILLRQQRDISYLPDDHDFGLLQKISRICDRLRILTLHTEINLRQRLKGLPETPLPEGYEWKQ